MSIRIAALTDPGDRRLAWAATDADGVPLGTAVLPEHRGRGLARWMKQRGIQLALDRHPLLSGLLTDTAADNLPIRRINEALGYRHAHGVVQYQLDLG